MSPSPRPLWAMLALPACGWWSDAPTPRTLPIDPDVPSIAADALPRLEDPPARRAPWDNFKPHAPLHIRFNQPELNEEMAKWRADFPEMLASRGVVHFELIHSFYHAGLVRRDDREGQVATFRQVAESKPDPQRKANLLVGLVHIGFEQQAIELAEDYQPQPWFRDSWDANFYIGSVHFRAGRYAQARPYLRRAHDLHPDAWTALWLTLALPADDPARATLFPFGPHMGPDDPSQFPFVDRARAWGIDRWGLAGSVAFLDVDHSGFLDLALTATYYAPELHRFDPQRGFARATGTDLDQATHLTPANLAADFDNDGHVDLFMASAAWFGAGPNRLFQGDGQGGFVDVHERAGDLPLLMQNSTGAAALDFDRDGLLDLAVTGIKGGDVRLLRNEGDLVFREVGPDVGIDPVEQTTIHLTVGDVNGDGWPDLFANRFGPNALYINQGDGTFRDEAEARGVAEGTPLGFGTWMFDVDGDGDLDIAAGHFAIDDDAFQGGFAPFPADHFQQARPTEGMMRPSALYLNDGTGHFEEQGEARGFTASSVMGAQFLDFDLDGDMDVVWGPGNHPLPNMQPLFVYRNDGAEGFTNITPVSDPRYYGKFHGMAFADVDRDGDPDLYINNGGVMLSDHWRDLFLENTTTGRHWLHLKLVGTESNRSAVGAQVRVTVGEHTRLQEVAVGQGFSGTNSPYLIFGLDQADHADGVEIRWPSGRVQRLPPLAADQAIVVTEGSEDLRRVY